VRTSSSEEPPCPQNVRNGQPPPPDSGRLLWTAPYLFYRPAYAKL